jgi:hypothetical protein
LDRRHGNAALLGWQNQGYAVLVPTIMDKKFNIEDIR